MLSWRVARASVLVVDASPLILLTRFDRFALLSARHHRPRHRDDPLAAAPNVTPAVDQDPDRPVVRIEESTEPFRVPQRDCWALGGKVHRVYYLVVTNQKLICEIYRDVAGGERRGPASRYLARVND